MKRACNERALFPSPTGLANAETRTAGFTTGTPWLGINANHDHINAATEVADPHSVYAYFKKLIALRKELPVIQDGDVHFVDGAGDKIIAYERTLGDVRVLVQCNFCGEEQRALPAEGGEVLIGNYDTPAEAGILRPWEAVAHIWR